MLFLSPCDLRWHQPRPSPNALFTRHHLEVTGRHTPKPRALHRAGRQLHFLNVNSICKHFRNQSYSSLFKIVHAQTGQ